MAENTEIVNLEFRTSGAQQASKDAVSVRGELEKIARTRGLDNAVRSAAQFSAETGKSRTALIRLQGDLAKFGSLSISETKKAAKDFDRYTESIKRSEAALRQAESASSGVSKGSGVFGRGGLLNRLGTEVKSLPAVQLPIGVSTDAVAKITSLLGAIGPAGVIASVGISAAALALGEIARQSQIATDGILADAAARAQVANELTNLNTTQLQTELENQKALVTGLEAQAADLVQKREDIRQQLLAAGIDFTDQSVGNRIRLGAEQVAGGNKALIDSYLGLGTQIEETSLQFNTASSRLQELAEAFGNEDVLRNSAEQGAEAQIQAIQKVSDQTIQAQIALYAQVDNLSEDSLNTRVKQLEREKEAIDQAIIDNRDNQALVIQLVERYQAINTELEFTETKLRPIVEDLARIAENDKKLKALADAAESFNTDSARLAASLRDSASKNADTLAKINSDLDKKLVDAANTRAKALVDAERDATNDRAEAIRERDNAIGEANRKAQLDREKEERGHQQRLQQIQREFNRSSAQAIADRDAVALEEARQTRDDANRDENESYQERLREIDRALSEENRNINMRYQEQQRTINQRLAEQNQVIQQRYAEQVQAAQIAAQQARQAEQQRYQEEQQAIQNQIRLRTNQYNQEIAIANAGANALIRIESQKQSILVAQAQAALRALTAGTSTGQTAAFNRNGTTYTIRANGGPLSSGQASLVNDRDRNQRESYTAGGQTALFPPGMGMFIPAKSGMVNANGGGGATNININLDGKTIQAMSRRMAIQTIDEILTQSGVN